MRVLTRREELLSQARRDLGAVVDRLLEAEQEVKDLREKVRKLEDSQSLNSRNSGKPPSSDGLAKPAPRSLRKKTGRKPGGQPGHPGHTLEPVKTPDHETVHCLKQCTCGLCGGVSLAGEPVLDYERRQVFELPPLRLMVTEHKAEIKRCPNSGLLVKAAFPSGVEAPVQYGPNFRGLMVYFSNQQLLPFDRLGQVCRDIFGQPLSLGTLTQSNQRAYEALAPVESAIVQGLQQAPVVHVDESGLRVEASLHWLHVASTPELTFYGVHHKRGKEAMDALGVLPGCHAWLMHDFWKPYFKCDALHALCNQHLLRELKFLSEEHKQEWASDLAGFLVNQKNAPQTAAGLDEEQFNVVLAQYQRIVSQGRKLHPRQPPAQGQGRSRQTKEANLLDRLEDYDLSVLAFLVDPRVPFTNNQGERDIRMVKSKEKISGGFRTFKGAQVFARIRGYFSTARKQGKNLWEAAKLALIGQPFMPASPALST